jgi:hypothetical protein
MPEYQRPPIATQAGADLAPPPASDPLEQLVSAVDELAHAWAYWITTPAGSGPRRDGRELLGAAVDGLLAARNRYDQGRRRDG